MKASWSAAHQTALLLHVTKGSPRGCFAPDRGAAAGAGWGGPGAKVYIGLNSTASPEPYSRTHSGEQGLCPPHVAFMTLSHSASKLLRLAMSAECRTSSAFTAVLQCRSG